MKILLKTGILVLIAVLFFSGCKGRDYVTPVEGEYPDNAGISDSRTNSAGMEPPAANATAAADRRQPVDNKSIPPVPASASEPDNPALSAPSPGMPEKTGNSGSNPPSGTVKSEPAPFPDDGRTPSYRQSDEFPDYAYHIPSLPRRLYTGSLNRGITGSYNIPPVKPVDFYNETTHEFRSGLISFFTRFINAYYNADYRKTDAWQKNITGFLDPKKPVVQVNGKSPETFVLDRAKHINNEKLITSVTEIITDESLIYLDSNAHFRVKGQVTLETASSASQSQNVESSSGAPPAPARKTFCVEAAFKERLLPGPGAWASEEYTVTLLTAID